MPRRRTGTRRWLLRHRAAVATELDRRRAGDGLFWDEVLAWVREQGAPLGTTTSDGLRKAWERVQASAPPPQPPAVIVHQVPSQPPGRQDRQPAAGSRAADLLRRKYQLPGEEE